jgi:hypothetical protein
MNPAEGALLVCAGLALWLVTKVGYVGMALWHVSRVSPRMQAALGAYREHMGRCVAVGAVNLVVGTGAGLVLLSREPLALAGLVLLSFLLYVTTLAFAVVYLELGVRVNGSDASSPRSVLLGGALAEAAFCTPVAGQLLGLALLCRGLGAIILAYLGFAFPPVTGDDDPNA